MSKRKTPPPLGRDAAAAVLRSEAFLQAGDLDAAERDARAIAASDNRSPEAHWLLGEVARSGGRSDEAVAHLRRAAQLDPDNADLHRALAGALHDREALEEAVASYRRALRLQPGAAETWNDLGTAYHALRRDEEAATCYRRAVKLAPEHVVAHSNLASTLRALGDVRGALRMYQREFWLRLRTALRRPRPCRRAAAESAAGLAGEAERWRGKGQLRMALALADWALELDPRCAAALATKASVLERNDDRAGAIALLREASGMAPADASLSLRLASAYEAAEQYDLAEASYRRAIALGCREQWAKVRAELCTARGGKIAEALAALERTAPASRDAETWIAIARLHLAREENGAALAALNHALRLDPASATPFAHLAQLHVAQREVKAALTACELALQRDPFCAEAHFWKGRALCLSNLWQPAIEAFREAAELDPARVDATQWIGVALRAAEELEQAQAVLRDGLERWPGNERLSVELAMAIFDTGDVARARGLLEDTLKAHPDYVPKLAAMCYVLTAEGDLGRAEAFGRRALELEPDSIPANQYFGLLLLKTGKFAEGWDRYEWRRRTDAHAASFLRFEYPEWDAEPLAGKTLLVYAEQGLGDEIMFASCLPDVMRLAARVVLECEPRLGKLLQRSFPGCAVFPRKRTQSNNWTKSLDPEPQFQVPIGSLPKHFRRRREDFPPHTGYLTADPQKVAKWRAQLGTLGPGRRFGLSWRGGLAKTGRARRSLELAQLVPLFRTPGTAFVNLQYGDVADEMASFERQRGVRLFSPGESIDDYDEAAALVSALDGVVTVCNSLVHLTGALGRPALVLAPFSPEWRYGMYGEEMPWYPSVRVLRQPTPGDWASVFAQVRAALDGGWGATP